MRSLIYDSVKDAPGLVLENQSGVDALFFLGLAPYLLSVNSTPRKIPWFCVGMPREGILTALLDARSRLGGKLRFSIECLPEKDVYELLDETTLDVRSVCALPYQFSSCPEQTLTDFHSRCYREGRVDFCLTWLYTAYERLKEMGIPAYYVSPTVHSIRESLLRAVAEISTPKVDRLKTAAALYSVENAAELGERALDEIRDAFVFQAIKSSVLPSVKTSSLFQAVGTDGQFQVITKNFTASPLRDAMEKARPDVRLRAGYGVAPLLSTAIEWAHRALESPLPGAESRGFLFDGRDFRQLGDAEPYAPLTPAQSDIACRLRITDATFQRYLHALRALESPFSTREFTHVTGIKPPASRKIFAMLTREKIIEATGKRPALSKGRPEILYTLNGSP